MVGVLSHLWTTLVVSSVYGRSGVDWDRPVGNTGGIDVTFHAAPAGLRPCNVIRAIRSHSG